MKSNKRKNNKAVKVKTEGNCTADIYVALGQLKIIASILNLMIKENIHKLNTINLMTKSGMNQLNDTMKKIKNVSDKILLKLDRVASDTQGKYIVEYLTSGWMKELRHDIQVDNAIKVTRNHNKKSESEKLLQYYMRKDTVMNENDENPNKKIKRIRGGGGECGPDQHKISKRVKTALNNITVPIPTNGKILSKKEMVEFYDEKQ